MIKMRRPLFASRGRPYSLVFLYCFLQGQSHRIQVEVKSVQESGTLPLMEESILSVAVGCVQIRYIKSPKSHENYQVEDSYCCIPKQLIKCVHAYMSNPFTETSICESLAGNFLCFNFWNELVILNHLDK